MKDVLLLRADASSHIGTGHVMRCLALAQAWQDSGGRVLLASAELPTSLADRMLREHIDLCAIPAEVGSGEDAAETITLAARHNVSWVVVDGYRFTPGYYEVLRVAGLRVLALDDMVHLNRYPVDLLLNQNLSAEAARYEARVEPGTGLLLGPRYALLRREFRVMAEARHATGFPPHRILVSFGGGDLENYTARILTNLAGGWSHHFEVKVLAGAANPHVESLHQLAAAAPFRCEVRVAEENVAAVMAWADAAITAAGSTVWELAAMRLPALIGAHEANQLAGLTALGRVPAFRAWTVDELLAQDLAAQLATLPPFPPCDDFDAGGAPRVVAHLQAVTSRFAPARIVA